MLSIIKQWSPSLCNLINFEREAWKKVATELKHVTSVLPETASYQLSSEASSVVSRLKVENNYDEWIATWVICNIAMM